MDKKQVIKKGGALSGLLTFVLGAIAGANAVKNANKEISLAEINQALNFAAKTTHSKFVEIDPNYSIDDYRATIKDQVEKAKANKEISLAEINQALNAGAKTTYSKFVEIDPNYAMNGYAIVEEDQAEETEKDTSVSDSVSEILDEIDKNLTKTNTEINETEYTKKTPDEWVSIAVLNAQSVLLSAAESDPKLNLLRSNFDTKEEVKALLEDEIANPGKSSIADYILLSNNEQFTTDINFWLRAYRAFSDAKQNVEDLSKGDEKPTDVVTATEGDLTIATPANSQDSQAETYTIIAALAAVAAIAVGSAALAAKRGLSRGRGMRIAGTRLATGKKNTWSARRLSRVANRIAKKGRKAEVLKQKALRTNNNALKKLNNFRANYRLGNNRHLNSLSMNVAKRRLHALEKKVYAITTAGQKIAKEQRMKFLKTYSRRAVWSTNKFFSANKQYFADNNLGLNQENYLNLMKGLNLHAKANLTKNTKKATNLSNKSVNLLNSVKFPSDSKYYGKNNTISIEGVNGVIPFFPERFVSLAELGNEGLKKNIETYFDEVSTMYPALEKETHYLTITFVDGKGENKKSHTISAGFDNAEAMKYIEANIIRALPTVTQRDDTSVETVSEVTIKREAHYTRRTTKTTFANYSTELELEALLLAQNLYLDTAQEFIKKPSVVETFTSRLITDSTNAQAPAASTDSSLSQQAPQQVNVHPSIPSRPAHNSSIDNGQGME